MTEVTGSTSTPVPKSPPETAFESAFSGEPASSQPKRHTLDHAFAMEATQEDLERERQRAHRPTHTRDLSGTFSFEATKADREHEAEKARKSLEKEKRKSLEKEKRKSGEQHHPHLDKIAQALFDPFPGEGSELAKKKEEKRRSQEGLKKEEKRKSHDLTDAFSMEATAADRHHEEEKARKSAEKRRSGEQRPHHTRDLSGTFSMEATAADRKHEEEKARKSTEKRRSGEHRLSAQQVFSLEATPEDRKREEERARKHKHCEKGKGCAVPSEEGEHHKHECPHKTRPHGEKRNSGLMPSGVYAPW